MVRLKSAEDIARMAEAGRVLAQTLRALVEYTKPDVTTADDLDSLAEKLIREAGGTPSFKGYRGFPKSLCLSVNEQVVHGIPNSRVLRTGDIVRLDVGVKLEGFHTDSAVAFGVGRIGPVAEKLIRVTQESLMAGIDEARPGNHLADIGHAVQTLVEKNGFSVVRELVGHGVGRDLHEDPEVPNYGRKGTGLLLAEGMTLAIEPMVNEGTHRVNALPDRWTVVTADGKMSAHFEHTVALTAEGPLVLTL